MKTMNFIKNYSIAFLSLRALSKVKLSTYSISAPIGTPLASLVTLIFIPSNILFIYKDVVSPSILGLKANIISLNFSSLIRSISLSKPKSSGLIPS